MLVLLVVERSKDDAAIWGTVWTSADDDPRLLESKQFKGEAAPRSGSPALPRGMAVTRSA
jgi:hypothetical protein